MNTGRSRSRSTRVRGGTSRTSFAATPLPNCNVSITNTPTIANTTNTIASSAAIDRSGSLEDIFEQTRASTDIVRRIDGRLKSLEEKTTVLASSMKELNDFIRKQQKDSFVIKGSQYEVSSSTLPMTIKMFLSHCFANL